MMNKSKRSQQVSRSGKAVDRYKGRPISWKKNEQDDIRKGEWHWSYTIILVGFFGGFFSLLFVGGKTVVSMEFLVRLVVFSGLVALVVPYPLWRKWLKIEWLEAVLLSCMGIGPLLAGLLLWTNYLIPLRTYEQTFTVQSRQSAGSGFSPGDVIVELSENGWADYPEFRSFDRYETPEISRAEAITYTVSDGLLGYTVVRDYRLHIP